VIKAGVAGESDLPAILLGIVVAYLTILISVAIAIFIEQKEFEALDRNVILDHVIKAKCLLLYLGLTFLPLLFWNGSLPWTRILEIIFWIIGVFFITKILINAYHWMKGNKFRLRFDYLRGLRNRQDMEEAWRSVWQSGKINFQNEQELFNIFHSTVNRLLENDEKR
jgi:amino acid transporter